MARLSFLLTVLVICVISAQGKREHKYTNTNLNENKLIRPGSNRGAKFLDTPVAEALVDGFNSLIDVVDDCDDDVIVSEEERKPPSRGDQSRIKLLNAGISGRVRPRGHGKINSDRTQLKVGQPKPVSVSVLLPKLIHDSAYPQSNIQVAAKPHVDGHSNRIRGQLIGVVDDDLVVSEKKGKPLDRGGQSLVELLNARILGRVRPRGNGKINSGRTQFSVGVPKPVPVKELDDDDYGILFDPEDYILGNDCDDEDDDDDYDDEDDDDSDECEGAAYRPCRVVMDRRKQGRIGSENFNSNLNANSFRRNLNHNLNVNKNSFHITKW